LPPCQKSLHAEGCSGLQHISVAPRLLSGASVSCHLPMLPFNIGPLWQAAVSLNRRHSACWTPAQCMLDSEREGGVAARAERKKAVAAACAVDVCAAWQPGSAWLAQKRICCCFCLFRCTELWLQLLNQPLLCIFMAPLACSRSVFSVRCASKLTLLHMYVLECAKVVDQDSPPPFNSPRLYSTSSKNALPTWQTRLHRSLCR
jgi:hypothetical protein